MVLIYRATYLENIGLQNIVLIKVSGLYMQVF